MYHANYECYGVRKGWHALRHEKFAVGRDQVARLTRIAGLRGRTRVKRIRTNFAEKAAFRCPHLVKPEWDRVAPA